jgi:hypothetical protein
MGRFRTFVGSGVSLTFVAAHFGSFSTQIDLDEWMNLSLKSYTFILGR